MKDALKFMIQWMVISTVAVVFFCLLTVFAVVLLGAVLSKIFPPQ